MVVRMAGTRSGVAVINHTRPCDDRVQFQFIAFSVTFSARGAQKQGVKTCGANQSSHWPQCSRLAVYRLPQRLPQLTAVDTVVVDMAEAADTSVAVVDTWAVAVGVTLVVQARTSRLDMDPVHP